LNNLPGGKRWLKRNKKEDAIVYFETFANVLEEKLLKTININSILETNKALEAELV
jgi:cytochrome b involved in lipid metabolism